MEWRTLGIIRVLHGYCKSDGDATRRCVDDGWRNERTERNCVDLFLFFFFDCEMTDLKYWITEESWRMDVVWKKFTLVRPFSREISLKFAVSKHRSTGMDTKVGKSAFGCARFNAPFCTRCTHTVNEVTKIHRMDRGTRRDQPPKG